MDGKRVALVTGAGRGLGAEIARTLAAAGLAVAVNDRPDSPGAPAVAAEIGARFVPGDITDEAAVRDVVRAVETGLGPIDVLVINATGPQPAIALEDLSWADMLAQLHFFVKSPLLLVQAVVPGMKQAARGRIVMIGSDLYERALPGLSAYSSAKGAQLGLTRTWARELGPYGITVNLVAPGWIPVERHADIDPQTREQYVDEIPLGRFGTPSDVAATVAFLASDAAGFITGERIAVNGGHTLA